MKRFKRVVRICSLILFMLLAVGGIGISGAAPVLTKNRKLFADIEAKTETAEKENKDSPNDEKLNF